MGIRLVYGLQTGDASYLDIFYPSHRLKEAALAASLDYAAMIHSPSDPPSRVLDFCTAGQEKHSALLRGELPDDLFSYLESAGITVVNPAAAVALARDKRESAGFFESLGSRHPRTVLTHYYSEHDRLPLPLALSLSLALPVEPPLPLPFVAKPRYGKMGRGVSLIEDQEQWLNYQVEAAAKGQETIVQEYIGAATGRDIRFFFADFVAGSEAGSGAGSGAGPGAGSGAGAKSGTGQVSTPGWVCVMRSAPGFLSNAHAGGSMRPFMPPEKLQCEAERIFALSGLVYGTVDFLFANEKGNEFVVCELNANPGFEELERAMKIDVASAIIASVMSYSANSASPGPSRSGKEGTP